MGWREDCRWVVNGVERRIEGGKRERKKRGWDEVDRWRKKRLGGVERSTRGREVDEGAGWGGVRGELIVA